MQTSLHRKLILFTMCVLDTSCQVHLSNDISIKAYYLIGVLSQRECDRVSKRKYLYYIRWQLLYFFRRSKIAYVLSGSRTRESQELLWSLRYKRQSCHLLGPLCASYHRKKGFAMVSFSSRTWKHLLVVCTSRVSNDYRTSRMNFSEASHLSIWWIEWYLG